MASNSVAPNELDFLVYRYLQDKGYTDAAFAFACESGINKIPVENDLVQPDSLVAVVEKGLQNLVLEANLGKQMPLEPERTEVMMEVDKMQSMWGERMQEIDAYIKLEEKYSELEQSTKDIKCQLVVLLRSVFAMAEEPHQDHLHDNIGWEEPLYSMQAPYSPENISHSKDPL